MSRLIEAPAAEILQPAAKIAALYACLSGIGLFFLLAASSAGLRIPAEPALLALVLINAWLAACFLAPSSPPARDAAGFDAAQPAQTAKAGQVAATAAAMGVAFHSLLSLVMVFFIAAPLVSVGEVVAQAAVMGMAFWWSGSMILNQEKRRQAA